MKYLLLLIRNNKWLYFSSWLTPSILQLLDKLMQKKINSSKIGSIKNGVHKCLNKQKIASYIQIIPLIDVDLRMGNLYTTPVVCVIVKIRVSFVKNFDIFVVFMHQMLL